jgi:hypothetical protein
VFVTRIDLQTPVGGDTTPPPAPALLGPANGATVSAPVDITLDWSDVTDIGSGILAYHVQMSPNPGFVDDPTDITATFYEAWLPTSVAVVPRSQSNTGTMYWRVQALDGANNLSPWSPARTFTVASPAPPAVPTLVSPPNGGTYAPGSISFAWNGVAGAASYTMQIDDSSSFSAPILVTGTVTDPKNTTTLTTQRTYWWRVRSNGSTGLSSAWSASRSFQMKSGMPAPPVPPATSTPPASMPGPFTITFSNGGTTFAGRSVAATITLQSPAPAGGATVALASQTPESVSVPSSATVPAGATTTTFTVTAPAGKQVGFRPTISGEYAGSTQGALIQVWADIPTYGLTLSLGAASVRGGTPVQGMITFPSAAPLGGVVVPLATSDPSVSVPASVTIPAGGTSATFPIATQPVAAARAVTIFAARTDTWTTVLNVNP